jgi:hypothetical protein
LLSPAAHKTEGAIEFTPDLRGGAATKAAGKLLRDGFIEEIPAGGALPVWRRDDDQGPLALRITAHGLAAIDVEARAAGQKVEKPHENQDGGDLPPSIEELDRRGIRTRSSTLPDGRVRGHLRFGAGPLAYLLKNRFYIGEIVYRGEVHRGEHEPILDRGLFEAVQAKLAANAVARQLRLKGAPAILTGRIFASAACEAAFRF